MRDTIRKSANRYSKRVPKNIARVQSAADLRIAAGRLQAADALRNNICPRCGAPVRQNLSLTGWVQCSKFGPGRIEAFAPGPCDWQGFTV